MKTYHYRTCCVDSTGEAINAMTDQAFDSSLQAMRRRCGDLTEWEKVMGYDTGNERGGLRLKDDWHVSFHRSRYRGQPCYYIKHSAIEYIWTEVTYGKGQGIRRGR